MGNFDEIICHYRNVIVFLNIRVRKVDLVDNLQVLKGHLSLSNNMKTLKGTNDIFLSSGFGAPSKTIQSHTLQHTGTSSTCQMFHALM